MRNLITGLVILKTACSFAQTPPAQTPDNGAEIIVHVVDEHKKPKENEKVYLRSSKTGKEYSGITDKTGQFSVKVPQDDKYNSTYVGAGGSNTSKVLTIPKLDGPVVMDYTITVFHPKVITLENVFFDTGKSTLRPESNKSLDDLAEYLNLKKTVKIEIGGHTDNVGDAASNLKLSDGRANAVRNYLMKKGVAGDRVIAKGYGDTMPVADNSTPEGKQKNRRTEVKTISE